MFHTPIKNILYQINQIKLCLPAGATERLCDGEEADVPFRSAEQSNLVEKAGTLVSMTIFAFLLNMLGIFRPFSTNPA